MHTFRKTIIAGGVSLALTPFAASNATSEYVPGEIYVAGDEVCYQGDFFRAKWWAGPNDVPSDVDTVSEPWETPLGAVTGRCCRMRLRQSQQQSTGNLSQRQPISG
ncbi:MAG: hypothetical protein R3F37_05135 [Candidatus Competibacteraceae bacterium]